MEVDDRLAFPVFQPPISRDFAVVIVLHPVALLPGRKLVGGQVNPTEESAGRQFRAVFPVVDVVNNLVSRVVRNPATG